jgi:hypothetical protein
MPNLCFVNGCGIYQGQRSFHGFPSEVKDVLRRKRWADFCQIPLVNIPASAGICERHFGSEDFVSISRGTEKGGKNILRADAVPSRNSPKFLATFGCHSPIKQPPPKRAKAGAVFVTGKRIWFFLNRSDI